MGQETSTNPAPANPFEGVRGTTPDEMREAGIIPERAHVRSELDDVIESMIREKGRPVPRFEILKELGEKGLLRLLPIDSKDPGAVITMRLKRRPRVFKRFDPQGWWIAELPYEPLNYFPNGQSPSAAFGGS
jgi:hypothetical protein